MFLQFNKIINSICFAADGDGGPALLDKEAVIDYLKDDAAPKEEIIELEDDKKKDDKKEDKEEKIETKPDEETEETDELKEIEEDLEEPDEEKLELGAPVPRRDILKKYPKLFEDFPALERSYYRDQQFSNYFETPAAAKEIVEKAEVLDRFEGDLKAGNITNMLKAAEADGNIGKVADNYMKALADTNEKAYLHVLGNVFKNLVNNMVEHSSGDGKEILKHAAVVVNDFVFGTTKLTPITKMAKDEEKDEKEDKISEKERLFNEKQFQNARGELNNKVNSMVRNTIKANIDTKGSMSDYVKGAAVRDAYESLVGLIERDTSFNKLIDKLWVAAEKSEYSSTSLNRIREAFISKAKTLLPSVIKKARIEALKGNNTKKVDKEEEDDSPSRKSSPPSKSRPSKESSKMDFGRKTTLELLMED